MPGPDFSGTWNFNPARSALQIKAPDATRFVIEHSEPLLRLSRTHTAGGKSDTFTLDLTTDGREVAFDHAGMRVLARAYWEGNTLVFDSRLLRGKEEASNVVRYSLSEDGKTFTAEERLRSREMNYDNVWVLERAETPEGAPPARDETRKG